MQLSRAELEALDRDSLIAQAEKCGVQRARILTRPELVDEILLSRAGDRGSVKKARGFFGMARDLLFRAVERGLNLPDAPERFRTVTPGARTRVAGDVIPTVTLAEIYAAQGHTKKAIDTVKDVLKREPDHAAAHALLQKLEDESYTAPAVPPLPPEEEAPTEDSTANTTANTTPTTNSTTTATPTPTPNATPRESVQDACIALPAEGHVRVAWRIRERALSHFRSAVPDGRLVLRAAVITPSSGKPRRTMRDVDVSGAEGSYTISGLPELVVVRVAVGMLGKKGFFPIAHSPATERDGTDIFVWTPQGRAPIPDDLASLADAR